MYMRFVHFKAKPEAMPGLSRLYDEKIIPTLRDTPGCLYATLIRGADHQDECISMTLWETGRHASEYERSGVFGALLRESAPYLSDTSEWKIQLAEDLTLRYEPVREAPVVDSYVVPQQGKKEELPPSPTQAQGGEKEGGFYVRIVSPRIRKGMMEEFRQIYNQEMLPQLRTTKGCRYAAMIENVREPEKPISITIWNSRQDADEYEKSGLFDALTAKVKHTFSEIYQWKMQLERETGKQVTTSEEISVEGYSVVTGKSFL